MRADVAVRERAVNRVGERMQRDVRVGMAAERLRMGNADPAQPDMIAGREGVDVEALADARLARYAGIRASAARKSCMVVTLKLAGSPSNTIGRRARPFGDRNVVGEVARRLPPPRAGAPRE